MKKMRFLSVALLSVLAIGALTGCNNDTDSAVTISVDNAATVVVGETLELPYTVEPEKAKIEVLNDHEEYVTAEADDGVLYLEGLGAGSATITLVGTYKKYTEANVDIKVSVITKSTEDTEPGVPDTGDDGGDTGGEYPGPEVEASGIALGEESDALANPGVMYVWADHSYVETNPVDITISEYYVDEGTYHVEYVTTVGTGEQEWYAVQLFLQLTDEELETAGLAEGDEYTVTLTFTSTVAGTITINGVEVEITAAGTPQEITVTSTTRVATEGFATVRIQLGSETDSTFLGDATIEVSGISLAKTATSDETEAITVGGIDDLHVETDGKMHYYIQSGQTLAEATHYLNSDTYVFDWSNAGSDWWGFQIMWMLDASQLEEYGLVEGEMYELTFKLNSSVAHNVTILGDEVSLAAGENDIDVLGTLDSTSGSYCTFHIWAGTLTGSLLTAGRFEISDIHFAHYDMPSEYDHDYSVDWTVTTLTKQDQENANSDHGHLLRWADDGTMSSNGTVTVSDETETLDESGYKATISIAGTSIQHWAYQLFYEMPVGEGPSDGTSYFVDVTMEFSQDITVTICGNTHSFAAGVSENFVLLSGHTRSTADATQQDDFEFQIGPSGTISPISNLTLQLTSLAFHWNN